MSAYHKNKQPLYYRSWWTIDREVPWSERKSGDHSWTTKLTFNITLVGTDVNRTLVKNLGRNIIRKLVVKLEGNEIISIDDYDVLFLYIDSWKCKTERLNAVF